MKMPLILALIGMFLSPAAVADSFRFFAMGDLPYRLPGDYAKFDRLIGEINRRHPAFSVHVGDIKSGSSVCSDQIFEEILKRFGAFRQPLFYTPGDNEWTDCHRKKAGGYDPLERLARIRKMFFAKPESFGAEPVAYDTQSSVEENGLPENATWFHGGVRFLTVHVVGSNNGMQRDADAVSEFLGRDAANLRWLARGFARAVDEEAVAVVVFFHANPLFEADSAGDLRASGFKRFNAALAEGSSVFGRPVLLVHGDLHELVVDRPLQDAEGRLLHNVTRLQVMGSPDVGAIEVMVDTDTNPMFAFTSIDTE